MSDRNIKKVIIMDIKQIDRCTKYTEIKPQSPPQISMKSQISKDESVFDTHYMGCWYIKIWDRLSKNLLKVIKVNES